LAWRTHPDAIVIDSGMTDVSGIEVCRLLRRDARFSVSTPIIVTTAGPAARADRLEAYRAGAWEYCSDPIDADQLLLKLETFIASKRELDQCHDDSLLDRDTGLYNVRGLTRRAQELGADASRRQAPLACVAVSAVPNAPVDEADLHEVAHRIAEHLGDIFRRTARVSDVIGHLGRSEFGIIAPATAASGAVRLVERIQETVHSAPFTGDQQIRLRAGYCAVPNFAESSVDAVELLLRAATALRHVKGSETTQITAFEDVPLRFVH
jgi:diguanylate cyclase (GGDEF)-like protein